MTIAARNILMLGLALLWALASCVANEAAAGEEAAPAHGEGEARSAEEQSPEAKAE